MDSSRGILRNQVISSLVWLWWVIHLARFEFKSGIVLFYFSFTLVLLGESRLLVSWCVGGRCSMACSDENRGRNRRPDAEDRGWSHRSGTRWPGGRVASYAVCTWHVETRSADFLVEPQNQGWQFVSGLASKPLERFSLVWPQTRWWWFLAVWPENLLRQFSPVWPQNWWRRFARFGLKIDGRFLGWASKPRWWRVSRFVPQNRQLWFGDLGLKITATVSWFGPQNQADSSLSVAPQNRWREVGVGHASRSNILLVVEASLARVSQSGLKTGGGAMTGGAHDTITEVASETSWRWMDRCDGLHRTLLPYLCCF
jgi:hypothetical protein